MGRYYLEYSRGILERTFFPLKKENTIGRSLKNDIRLNEPEVSRRHALLLFREGQWILQDLGSQNGTFVNRKKIQECVLKPGDQILVASAHLRFLDIEAPLGESIAEDSEAMKMTEESGSLNLPREISNQIDLVKTFHDALPIGVAIINEKMEILYHNQALASFGLKVRLERGGHLCHLKVRTMTPMWLMQSQVWWPAKGPKTLRAF